MVRKLSSQRQAILDLVNSTNRHWDAEEMSRALADRGQSIGIATVYRGLAALESAGFIHSIQMDGKKYYERADKEHHDHMVCTSCGAIREFVNPDIESLQVRAARANQFTMTGHQLLIFGVCGRCAAKNV